MILAHAKKMIECRKNLIGFLPMGAIKALNTALNTNVDKMPFHDIAELVFNEYESKRIDNKTMSGCINILINNNMQFRIERFRINKNTGDIHQYSEDQNCYIFHCKIDKNSMAYIRRMTRISGKYVD